MKTITGTNHYNTWEIYLFNDDSKVINIHQVPDFTVAELLSVMGGTIGLAIGASNLSFVELGIYLVMFVIRKLH